MAGRGAELRLGVLGGSFDPVHIGHLALAVAALEAVPLDRVLFVPARRSPLKGREPVAPAEDRLAMLELALAGEPRFAISRLELDRPGPSYTVATLEALRVEGELFLLLGSDSFAELPRWHEPERIAALATILVAERPGASGTPMNARTVDAPRLEVSSRELRARAGRGRSLRYLVPDPVWRYIQARGLYGAEPAREAEPRT